jgi:hypothetical protein
MFGITMKDTNGVEYGFAIDTVEQVRELARESSRQFGTGVIKATYRNEDLSNMDMATLAYGSLPWEPRGF